MKKLLLAMAVIAACLAPALLAQDTPIAVYVPGKDKLKLSGELSHIDIKPSGRVILKVTLSYQDRAVTGARVWLNKERLGNSGGGNYVGAIDPYIGAIGNRLEISVELLDNRPFPVKPPFTGKQKLATYRIGNLIEWLFPYYTEGQVIDLAAYPSGIPFRWNFLAAPAPLNLYIWERLSSESSRQVFTRTTDSEMAIIPVGTLQPGKLYSTGLQGELGLFALGTLAAPTSEVRYHYSSIPARFTTRAAKVR